MRCRKCGYEQAELAPRINCAQEHQLIAEDLRAEGLRKLRRQNFRTLLAQVSALRPQGGRLLDVGCAHGWFLELAQEQFTVLGLEPDRKLVESIARRGLPVREGYFPQALEAGERFEVIAFNDVLEHIADVPGVLAACRRAFDAEGLLVLTLPNSHGFFYQLSKALLRLGLPGFLARMWQKGLPSPHRHYFNPANLSRLLADNGFEVKRRGVLPTLTLAGLHERIAYDQNLGALTGGLVYLGAVILIPFLRVLPSDIFYLICRKQERPSG